MLADVFDNDGLILCELVDRGLLDRLSPEDLAEVFSWFSFDRDFRYGNSFTLPDQLILFRRRLEDLEQAILGEERDNGLAISEGHNPTFYGAARAWCQGLTMTDITGAIDLSEGDLVMTFNKTIDLMRQVRDMLTNVLPDHPLRNKLAQSEKLLRRGIVEQSLTIGFSPIETPETPADERVEADDVDEPAAVAVPVIETPTSPETQKTRSRKKSAESPAPETPAPKPAKQRGPRKTRKPAERSSN
jgi:ATP-dependent RNA helicase HelY